MKKITTILLLLMVTGLLFANTTPISQLQLNMTVAQSIATKITDSRIPFVASFDEAVILTEKNVVLDGAGTPTDTEFHFNVMTNLSDTALQISVKPVKFMRTGGGASAIGYTLYETSKGTTAVVAGLSSGDFQNFYTISSSVDGTRVLDSRKMIVEISNEDYQSTLAGDFTATIYFQVTSI